MKICDHRCWYLFTNNTIGIFLVFDCHGFFPLARAGHTAHKNNLVLIFFCRVEYTFSSIPSYFVTNVTLFIGFPLLTLVFCCCACTVGSSKLNVVQESTEKLCVNCNLFVSYIEAAARNARAPTLPVSVLVCAALVCACVCIFTCCAFLAKINKS